VNFSIKAVKKAIVRIMIEVIRVAAYVQGLLLRWYSMLVQPERQTSSEPKAEDMYKR